MDPHEQRAFFEQQGYLIVPDLLNSREVAECQREIQRLHQLAADLEASQDPLSRHFQREPFSKDQNRNGLPVLRKVENTRALSPCFAQLAAHPRLVAIVQSLLADDLLLFRSTLMLKPRLPRLGPRPAPRFSLLANGATRSRDCEHRPRRRHP